MRIKYFLFLIIFSFLISSCSTSYKMSRVDRAAFHIKESKESKKIKRQNKRIYRNSKPIKR